ncbi:hypothetical protein N0V95_004200 [Ascochyta clinopodiicola]|nr:hypothetical protein N0V95_004200 [Ascochyta clinopodiicola]
MSRPPLHIKPVSEKKREREVLQYVAAYRDLPRIDELGPTPESCQLPVNHHARPSSDSTLTALVQLAALRMGAQRALVSLIDDTHQHVLAEATPRSPLRVVAEGNADAPNSLWLGSVSIPRSWGVCEQVLELDHPARLAAAKATSVVINKDLQDSERHASRTYVRDGPCVRFYAGAALVNPHGAIIGALCVFDDKPRPEGVADEDVRYLEDLSAAVVEYLGTYTVRDRFKRGEKLTRGLISFAEGASALLPLDNIDQHDDSDSHVSSTATSITSTTGSNADSQTMHGASAEQRSPSQPHESNRSIAQPSQTDDSQSSGQGLSRPKPQRMSTGGSDTVRAGSTRNTSLRALQDTILPMNARSMFARAANVILASSNLDGVLILDASIAATGHRQHPAAPEREHANGDLSDAAGSGGTHSKSESSEESSNNSSSNNMGANSSSPKAYRLLSASVDLAYFTIFSHSIMRELSRLDAVALNQQKTTFVASISHELRSPLHGILGTLEFIKDTPLDAFQTSMLNSLNSCGQTLLDTINHVMDHSKMSETTKNVSTRRLKNTKTVRLSSKPLKTRRLRDPAFDLGIATEEVVEAVFAGSSFLPIMSSKNAPVSPTESTSDHADITSKRKTCYIVLDIAREQDWVYCFPVGSWKRAVMNLFGNAVKYTATGHVTVSLHATDVVRSTGSATTVTLTVTDTGTGMSPAFLANKAFQPFSQENPHSSGVGLGLSIVRQIIETNGGKIEVSSDHSSGTKITVKLSLIRPDAARATLPQRDEYLSWLPRLKGRKVCILCRPETNQDIVDEPQNAEGLSKLTHALATTLAGHLKMDVVQTTKWEGNDADLVICPEPSFDYLASIRHQRADAKTSKAAVTIFVALDALEASTLRSDVRVRNKESVVEIMTQPLGPYKLAYVLNKCLDRFEHPDENVQPASNLTRVSTPNLPQPTLPEQQTTISPRPVEMPPLLHQPHWAETDFPQVLITDDNAINRRLLVAFTKKYDLEYTEAENGLEALRAYQSAQVQFDVILMDMSMPVMDGMSATRAIRQYEQEYNVPRCCIIALTGLASASAKLEAWNSGIDHFMTKPVNFKALEKFLKKEETRREKAADAHLASGPATALYED